MFPVTHVSGTVRYKDGATSDLHVIKLGLHPDNLAAFEPYRRTDGKFPHHSTLNQLYPTARMEQYRNLGRDNANRCLSEIDPADSSGTKPGVATPSEPPSSTR